jgi:hypothetical protein
MRFSLALFLCVSSLVVDDGFGFVSSSISKKKSFFENRKELLIPLKETPDNKSDSIEPPKERLKAIILEPCIEAMDPKYPVRGSVGDGDFIISRSGGPTDEELTDENLYNIINRKFSDLEVNTLVWKCLGYRFDAENEAWTPKEVFPKWKDRFPEPPDFVGMQRVFSKEVDGPVLRNNQSLVRSIPNGKKKSYLKEYMLPFGFTGYKVRNKDDDKYSSVCFVLNESG